MKLAIFDFDGTITRKDSLLGFIQFSVGKLNYYIGLFFLSSMLTGYVFKLTQNSVAKEKLFSYFFKGWSVEEFNKMADSFSLEKIDSITRPKAIEKIKWHQKQGHKVLIVSASIECWLKAWCQKNMIELIATKLEVRRGKITGNFSTKNCHGSEKVKRIKEIYDLSQYDYIYAYGDSRGDHELLALADESFYKPFRN